MRFSVTTVLLFCLSIFPMAGAYAQAPTKPVEKKDNAKQDLQKKAKNQAKQKAAKQAKQKNDSHFP